MILELHSENRIGYKTLSPADLGLGGGHQTHIGLYNDVLTFLNDRDERPEGMLIYENSLFMLPTYFDRIERNRGDFDSPKIRLGNREDGDSVARRIRTIVRESGRNDIDWRLIWFGLSDRRLVFVLYDAESDLGVRLGNILLQENGVLREGDPAFAQLLKTLETLVNERAVSELKDLEIFVQTSNEPRRSTNEGNFRRAREQFERTGREGEELINAYFTRLKAEGTIRNFAWCNETEESAMPYDFRYTSLDGSQIYLDVKTTSYEFAQKMIFSNQEIDFAHNHQNCYHIYRVYKSDNSYFLRICNDTSTAFSEVEQQIAGFIENMRTLNGTGIETIKLSISPETRNINFGEKIALRNDG